MVIVRKQRLLDGAILPACFYILEHCFGAVAMSGVCLNRARIRLF